MLLVFAQKKVLVLAYSGDQTNAWMVIGFWNPDQRVKARSRDCCETQMLISQVIRKSIVLVHNGYVRISESILESRTPVESS